MTTTMFLIEIPVPDDTDPSEVLEHAQQLALDLAALSSDRELSSDAIDRLSDACSITPSDKSGPGYDSSEEEES